MGTENDFGRIRNGTTSTPGTFVFELGWDQVPVRLLMFRVSGLFPIAKSIRFLSREPA